MVAALLRKALRPRDPRRRLCCAAVALFALWPALVCAATAQPVMLLTLDGAVSPATADYMLCVLRASSAAGGEIILLQYLFAIKPNMSK